MKSFNSTEYAWKDIEVVVMGRPLIRILEVEYVLEVEQKALYGRGKKILGIQNMNEKVSGQITVGQSELEAMIREIKAIAPNMKLTDVSLDINVGYLADTEIIRDRIVSAKIGAITKGMKQGDSDMQIKLPFMAVDVEYAI